MKNYFLFLLISILILSSCASRKDVIYFQHNQTVLDSAFDAKYSTLKPLDKLSIMVSASDPEVVKDFTVVATTGGAAQVPFIYTVDKEGFIVFPYLGKVNVQGKTRLEAIDYLRSELSKYIKDPMVNISLDNFQVTLLGSTGARVLEIKNNDRPTIIEAIAQAGDLAITAKRNDILVIREENGVRKSYRLDIRDANILHSPAYYLAQNDIIYVEPNSTGIQANRSTWYLTLGMTVITVGLTLYSLFK